MRDKRAIGVIDSGIGGLTVVKEIQRLLPNENIIYFGDNANVPYGNRSEEEIYKLAKNIIDYLKEKDVKIITVACNTISSLLDRYFLDSEIPIVSIIEPVAEYVNKNRLEEVGVMATKFTVESGTYEKFLRKGNENIKIVLEACPSLAGIIDSGNYKGDEIGRVIDRHMTNIVKEGKPRDIILGCTHYPIVLDKFKDRSPDLNFINPAYEQVRYLERLMKEKDISGNSPKASFEIYTTGHEDVYVKVLDLLEIEKPERINTLDILKTSKK